MDFIEILSFREMDSRSVVVLRCELCANTWNLNEICPREACAIVITRCP